MTRSTHHYLRDAPLARLLSAVKQQQGLDTCDEAAEFLLRRSLQKGAQQITGQRPANYQVKRRH